MYVCLFLYNNNNFVMSEDCVISKIRCFQKRTGFSYGRITAVFCYFVHTIRASVDALCRDGTEMRGDAQNPKSFQAPRM